MYQLHIFTINYSFDHPDPNLFSIFNCFLLILDSQTNIHKKNGNRNKVRVRAGFEISTCPRAPDSHLGGRARENGLQRVRWDT